MVKLHLQDYLEYTHFSVSQHSIKSFLSVLIVLQHVIELIVRRTAGYCKFR